MKMWKVCWEVFHLEYCGNSYHRRLSERYTVCIDEETAKTTQQRISDAKALLQIGAEDVTNPYIQAFEVVTK